MIKEGHIKPEEALFQLTDETDKRITMHGGSVYWNDYRQRWIMIGLEAFGTSLLGEIWYAEAEQLVGPWTNRERSSPTRSTASTTPSSTRCSTKTAAA